jgi:hypothetical protein
MDDDSQVIRPYGTIRTKEDALCSIARSLRITELSHIRKLMALGDTTLI